jgi:hypothetical protein
VRTGPLLPRRFVRIRFSGFLANRRRKELLPLCNQLLEAGRQTLLKTAESGKADRCAGWFCPHYGSPMIVIAKLTAQQVSKAFVDTS